MSRGVGVEPAAEVPRLPGLAALGAWLAHQDRPLVGRPPDDQPMAVGAVAEGVGLLATVLQVLLGFTYQLDYVLLGVAGFPHGADRGQHEP